MRLEGPLAQIFDSTFCTRPRPIAAHFLSPVCKPLGFLSHLASLISIPDVAKPDSPFFTLTVPKRSSKFTRSWSGGGGRGRTCEGALSSGGFVPGGGNIGVAFCDTAVGIPGLAMVTTGIVFVGLGSGAGRRSRSPNSPKIAATLEGCVIAPRPSTRLIPKTLHIRTGFILCPLACCLSQGTECREYKIKLQIVPLLVQLRASCGRSQVCNTREIPREHFSDRGECSPPSPRPALPANTARYPPWCEPLSSQPLPRPGAPRQPPTSGWTARRHGASPAREGRERARVARGEGCQTLQDLYTLVIKPLCLAWPRGVYSPPSQATPVVSGTILAEEASGDRDIR